MDRPSPIVRSVSALYRLNAHWHNSHAQDYGVGSARVALLICVCDHGGMSQHQLVRETCLDKSVVTRSVANLVSDGYLERGGRAEDGRSVMLLPTQKAWDLYPTMVANARTWIDAVTHGMTSQEVELLVSLLARAERSARDFMGSSE